MSAPTDTPFPNQPPPYADRNLYADDVALQGALDTKAPGGPPLRSAQWGAQLGAAATLALGDDANRHPPELATHDARGERIDAVTFHPAWHALMRLAHRRRRACASVDRCPPGRAGGARRARPSACAGGERHAVPADDDVRSVPVLAPRGGRPADARTEWLPKILARDYDPRAMPIGAKARRADRHGHDRAAGRLRRARQYALAPSAGRGRPRRLTGHKWFFSAPQCDAHLVLAQDDDGLSCFLLPRMLPDGARNADPDQPAQGQARQPLERVGRSRVRRRARLAGRRAGTRRRDDPRDGPAHAARLRARQRRHDARGAGAGDASRAPPRRVRPRARRRSR